MQQAAVETPKGSHVTVNRASRRPIRLSAGRLPPEVVGKAKWAQRIWRELRGQHSQADPPPEETWRRKIWCMRNGFMPMCYDLYSLDKNDPRDYLSDREREMTWILNWPYAGILDDKLGFDYMIKQLGAPTPATRALIIKGRLTPMDDARDVAGTAWWQERLEDQGRLVLKPIWGAKGNGIKVVERSDGGCRLNGKETKLHELQQRIADMDRYLVSDYVQQADYAEEIFPGSANSMRVLTMQDEEGVPFIAAAAHRFGAQRSKGPVDSWSAGGLSAGVDLDTGELSEGVTSLEFARMERHPYHPDTGTPIKGNHVANWDLIKAGLVELAGKLPFLPYIGWDVISTNAGYMVIEGNKQSNVGFLQVHRPLLRDPKVRAFYEREGII